MNVMSSKRKVCLMMTYCVTLLISSIAPIQSFQSVAIVKPIHSINYHHPIQIQQQQTPHLYYPKHSTTALASSVSSVSVSEVSSSALPSLVTSAATLDPTSFLSDVFGGVLGSPIILAIPIVAALGVASLIAYLIIAYANPAADD